MKIAVLSDTRLPTTHDYPGHGLGKQVLLVAEGLAQRGHAVTLFAGAGSKFDDGALVVAAEESKFTPFLPCFDVVLDSTHQHTAQQSYEELPIVNWSHDREAKPGRCAVFPSQAHRDWHRYKCDKARVIYNAIPLPDMPDVQPNGYFAYLSMMHAPKAPIMAVEAARLAGVRLVMAGPTPPAIPPGAEYIGPISGMEKLEFLAGARALLFGSSIEAGPVTPLEAQAVACPVIVSAYGAAKENMQDGLTGLVVRDTLEMTEAIYTIGRLPREFCRTWVEECRSVETMIGAFENALVDCAQGRGW